MSVKQTNQPERRSTTIAEASSRLMPKTRARRALTFALAAGCFVALVAIAGASKGVLTHFGTEGTGDGEFNTPASVAVNRDGTGTGVGAGDSYVVDQSNDRVVQFDSDGAFVRAFGWGVDDGSDAFQVCTSDCQGAVAPGAPGAPGALPFPTGIAIDQSTGNVFVVDRTDRRITAFNPDGTLQGVFGYGVAGGTEAEFCASGCSQGGTGPAAGQLGSAPEAIAVDPTNQDVLVADRSNKRVVRYEVTLDGSDQVTDADFAHAFGWDVDPAGLADAFEVCTTATGCRAGQGTGNAPGQFYSSQPVDVAVDSTGAVYTAESTQSSTNQRRVEKFVPGGGSYTPSEFAAGILGSDANNAAPTDVAIGASDNVFVVKQTPSGATPSCPNGNSSSAERRVIELDSTGAYPTGEADDTHLVCAGLNSMLGIATDPPRDRFLVSSTTGDDRIYVAADVPPPSADILPATGVEATGATLHGEVNPNGVETSYRFEYSSDGGSTWQPSNLDGVELGSGTGLNEVEAELAALLPNTTYRARIVAFHPFGAGTTVTSHVEFTTDAEAPVISMAASVAGRHHAELHSIVAPRGSDVTECRFEWGEDDDYGNNKPCDDLPGNGQGHELVSATVPDLESGNIYHYRLRTESAAGETVGPDRTIEVGTQLPDKRAWEMVTPPDKNGGEVLARRDRTQAALDGNSFAFSSAVGFGDTIEGGGKGFDYLSVRDESAGRWASHAISPRQDSAASPTLAGSKDAAYRYFSDDLAQGITMVAPTTEPLVSEGANVTKVENLYRRDDLLLPNGGSYKLVTLSETQQAPAALNYRPVFRGASSDFTHVAFESTLNLTAAASGNGVKAYEWIDGPGGGSVRLASILPNGSSAPAAAILGDNWWTEGSIAANGASLLFSTPTNGGSLFMRINGTETIQINQSERTTPETPDKATFELATDDHSRVVFITRESLVDEDNDSQADIYMYDATRPASEPDNLTLLSMDNELADGDQSASANGVAAMSPDGQSVYFIHGGRLTPDAHAFPGDGSSHRIYRWKDGALTFVGAIGGNLADLTHNRGGRPAGAYESWSRTTADGSKLLFASTDGSQLGGFEHGDCSGTGADECSELYLFDANANAGVGSVACVSCPPSGDSEDVETLDDDLVPYAGALNTLENKIPRLLSDDGRYVFFDTRKSLVAHDTNGDNDTYRYDATTGELALISGTGSQRGHSFFVSASADGRDAFFATRSRLSGWDIDNGYDIYDARIGGGLPEPEASVPECHGDACQEQSPDPPDDEGAESTQFEGSGNNAAPEDKGSDCTAKRARANKLRRLAGLRVAKARELKKRSRRASRDSASRRLNRKAKTVHKRAKRTAKKAQKARRAMADCRESR